ncbi:MAG: DNA circularization N-terminal domain-containing protein [Candidatus Lernaella stagnicola]|nr:DNA circularization N-terminal domain-containing protein [Candidatus Lernaella stagnicola]
MNIWLKNSVPAFYDGFPLFAASARQTYEFNTAAHGAVGRLGEVNEPLGAKSRVFDLTFVFIGTNFEAHKTFARLLDGAIVPMKPGILIHPTRGMQQVYPLRYTEEVDARELCATISVTFRRHAIAPEITAEFGVGVPVLFDLIVLAPNLGRYLASLAFITGWNAAALAAIMMLVRIAGDLPTMIDRSIDSLADSLQSWFEGKLADPFDIDSPTEDLVKARYDVVDQINRDTRKALGLREAVYQGILDGTYSYDPGVYAGGAPTAPGVSSPPASQHAALVAVAQWETAAAAYTANQLIAHVQAAARAGTLDAVAADAAAVFLRRRIRNTIALQSATNPYYAGPAVTQLSRVGDSLVRTLAQIRSPRLQVRRETLDRDNRPLVLWTVDWLGAANRAGEIRALNPNVRGDWNRLPAGTDLRVPAA